MAKAKITNEKELQANIQRLEGNFRPDVHMVRTYVKDTDETVNIPHIGYGFKIDKKDYAFYNLLEDGTQDPNKPAYIMSKDVADKRFLKEYNKAHKAAKKLAKVKNITEFGKIAALTDIAYNMGTEWHLKFPSAMKALNEKNYLEFTKELLRGKDKFTKSKYVKDVGINRVTENTLLFGYDHTEAYNSGDLYKEASKEFISSENPVPEELYRNTPLDRFAFSPETEGMGVHTPRGFLYSEREVIPDYSSGERETFLGDTNIGLSNRIDDNEWWDIKKAGDDIELMYKYRQKFEEGGEIDPDTPVGIPPGADLDPNQPQSNFPIIDDPEDLISDSGFVDDPNVISEVKPDTTLEIPEDTTPPPTYDKTEGFYSVNPAPDETADQFAQRTTETQPAITTQPVDEGSWSPPEGYVSPRISTSFEDLFGDSSWGSTAGTTTTTTDSGTKGSWVQTDLPFPKDTSLSPSQQSALTLLGISNDVVAAEATKVGGDYGSLNETFISDYLYNHFGIGNFNQIDNLAETGFKNVYGLDDTFTDSVNVELQKSFDQYGVKTLEEIVLSDTTVVEIDKNGRKITAGEKKAEAVFKAALDITKTNQIIDDISKVEGIDSIMTFGSGKTIGPWNVVEDVGGVKVDILDKTDWSQQYDVDGNPIYTSEGMLTESVSKHVNDWASTLTLDEKDILIDLGKEVTPTKWFETISNKTIGNMYGHEMQVKDLYDEFGATLFVGYMTEDWGKAALAGGTQFLKTDFVKGFSSKIGTQAAQGFSSQISGATSVAEINATFKKAQNVDYDLVDPNTNLEDARRAAVSAAGGQAAAKFELYAGVAASMFQSFVMGGDTEDVIWAGAEHAIMHFGAQPVGEFLNVTSAPGIEGGAFNAQEAVGGAVISSLITLARTGDIGQAALSGATSYLFAVNPIFGTLAMMTQVMFGQGDPKNYAGYTSVNLEDMSVQSFSQGDVDKSKASPENTAFTQEVVNNIMPLLEPITEAYGVTKWLGDVEIQYGHRDGLFLTIVNKDITGFTNRADYNEEQGDLSSNDVYQRKFNSLADLQDHFMEIMTFAAEHMRDENGVVDLTGLIGQRNIYHGNKFYEYVNEKNIQLGDYSNRGAGIVNFENIANIQDTFSDNIKRGGKISLDKGGDVQYNKGNYGFVNKKDKAPPSARADDVPMNLKEGDFVLSQPAVALYGKDTIDRMLSRAATDAGTNLKSGGKVPVNVHNGEYIIPKNLTEYIGSNVLNTMNDRGLMSVGERPNT